MTLDELRDHVRDLEQLGARMQRVLLDVRAAHAAAQARLVQLSRDDLNMRPLGATAPPNGRVVRSMATEEIRDAVVKLKHFTLSELAAELGCSTRRAGVHMRRVDHLVRDNGYLGSSRLYAYIEPAGPGEAFEAQQRLRSTSSVEVGDMAVGRDNAGIKQSMLSQVTPKELREVCREAIADGWTLVHSGGKHPFQLERGGAKVRLSSTPTNPGHAAKAIRRQLRTS